MKRPSSDNDANGLVPAIASGLVPGLGQLLNKDGDKAIGIFVVFAASLLLSMIPIIGVFPFLAAVGTWGYGVIDGYVSGKANGKDKSK